MWVGVRVCRIVYPMCFCGIGWGFADVVTRSNFGQFSNRMGELSELLSGYQNMGEPFGCFVHHKRLLYSIQTVDSFDLGSFTW